MTPGEDGSTSVRLQRTAYWWAQEWVRFIAFGATAVAIVVVQLAAGAQFRRVMSLFFDFERKVKDERKNAAVALLDALFAVPQTSALHGLQFRVYSLSKKTGRLIPSYSQDRQTPGTDWEIGTGCVGFVWANQESEVAIGQDELTDAKFNLSPDQIEKYEDLEIVVAAPCLNARRRVVAVVSGSAKVGPTVDRDRIRADLVDVARAVSRVQIDLFRFDVD